MAPCDHAVMKRSLLHQHLFHFFFQSSSKSHIFSSTKRPNNPAWSGRNVLDPFAYTFKGFPGSGKSIDKIILPLFHVFELGIRVQPGYSHTGSYKRIERGKELTEGAVKHVRHRVSWPAVLDSQTEGVADLKFSKYGIPGVLVQINITLEQVCG